MPNVALGKTIEEPITNPAAATDGDNTGYTDYIGFADATWPCMLTVDLGASYNLVCIRILLWDGLGESGRKRDNRVFKYRLLTSIDHQVWKVIFDSSHDGSNGWQVFTFSDALNTRYIRIHGLSNSANEHFQVVQVEAHDNIPPDLDAEIVLQRTIQTKAVEEEVGDGLPLQARIGGIINGIERLIEGNELLNPKPFKELISQLRVQVRDVTALERGMDSIRREIISPVREELEHSAKLGKFSVWGFWVGLIGGVLAIVSIALALTQWPEAKSQMSSQPKDVTQQIQSTPTPQVQVQQTNTFNAPQAFSTAQGFVSATQKEWKRSGQNYMEFEHGKKIADFQFSERFTYDNCRGSLFYNVKRREFEIFVPDLDCPTMKAMRRKNKEEWEVMGEMKNIQ
jgi:hypothetical protein